MYWGNPNEGYKKEKRSRQGEHLEYNTGKTPVEGEGKGKRIQQEES